MPLGVSSSIFNELSKYFFQINTNLPLQWCFYINMLVVTKIKQFIFVKLEYTARTTWLNNIGYRSRTGKFRNRKSPNYPLFPLTIHTFSVESHFPQASRCTLFIFIIRTVTLLWLNCPVTWIVKTLHFFWSKGSPSTPQVLLTRFPCQCSSFLPSLPPTRFLCVLQNWSRAGGEGQGQERYVCLTAM